jgi:DNA ligase 1
VRAYWDGRALRFRSGQRVAAPEDFLSRLPAVAMDGELWLGGGSFEALVGIVRRQTPNAMAWGKLRYRVFELPHGDGDFATRAASIRTLAAQPAWPQLVAVEQAMVADRHSLRRRLDAVIAAGGERLMLHRADAPYRSGRRLDLLKLKPLQDAEALVIGHVGGRGRHAGRPGALRVRTADGVEFLLGSGLSDAARASPPALGTIVSFTHRGHTNAGVPRFASFLRQRLL